LAATLARASKGNWKFWVQAVAVDTPFHDFTARAGARRLRARRSPAQTLRQNERFERPATLKRPPVAGTEVA
jgi:hypothetical protein